MSRSRNDLPSYPIQLRRAIALFLPARGLAITGPGRWADRFLVLAMLLLVFSGRSTQKDRFAEARKCLIGMYPSRQRPGTSLAGFMGKMARQSARLLGVVCGHLRRQMPQRLGKQWLMYGWRVFGVDGSKMDCPRTKANKEHFKNGGRKKSGPQLLLVCLIHLGSGLLWSWRQTGARGSERGLLKEMLGDLPDNALLVADAGFLGFDVLTVILGRGHSVLMRVGASVCLLKKLGYSVQERAGVVYLWPESKQKKQQTPLALRLITVIDGRNRKMCLLTNILSTSALSDAQAVKLYQRRWGLELLYRGMKQTLQRRKMLSDAPRHAQVELDWSVLGLWLITHLLWEHRKAKTPVHEGLAQTLRIVRAAMAGGTDQRRSLALQLRSIQRDIYQRKGSKTAVEWPHKKKDKPCGIPQLRVATKLEVRRAKGVMILKQAA